MCFHCLYFCFCRFPPRYEHFYAFYVPNYLQTRAMKTDRSVDIHKSKLCPFTVIHDAFKLVNLGRLDVTIPVSAKYGTLFFFARTGNREY